VPFARCLGTSSVRILLCGINYAPDLVGVAKYNAELCDWMASRGHDLRVITAPPYYPQWRLPSDYRRWSYKHENFGRVALLRAPIYVPRIPNGPRRLLHHASFALSSAGPVIAQAMRWRPDLMLSVVPSLMSAFVVAATARRLGIPSWLHLQDFEIDAAFDLGLLHHESLRRVMLWLERRILHSFDRVSSISPCMLTRLEAKGVVRERLCELRNWIDTDVIRPNASPPFLRRALGVGASDVVALYSGTMSHKQGLDLIIDAARALAQEQPSIRFVLCGDGPYKSCLMRMAEGLDNVRFVGLQPDEHFASLLATADIHLLPQLAAAADLVLPSKLGGIFASGRPVVAMAANGTGLALEASGAGLVVDPGDVQGLTSAIRTLATDPDLRQRLGVAGRERALTRWDKKAILVRLEYELNSLCDKSTPAHAWPPAHEKQLSA
jgi:colanic acid biosynthesis glycosyl transferase WcaI